MIYVNQAHVAQVEYLLGQAMQGNHVLFDAETLRKALRSQRTPVTEEDSYAVEPHIEKLLELPTLEQKRAYLESLGPSTLENVVHAYFNIVENTLYESITERH